MATDPKDKRDEEQSVFGTDLPPAIDIELDEQVAAPEETDEQTEVAAPSRDEGVASEAAEELRAQLEEAQRRANDAERRAAEATQARDRDANSAATNLAQTQLQVISNAIAAANGDLRELRGQRIAARQAGDLEAEADAEEKLAMLSVRIQRMQEGKNELESGIEAERTRPPKPTDPVEAYAAQLTPRSAKWVKDHPEVVTSRARNANMVAAHEDALETGIEEGSDAYYQYVEERLGYRKQEEVAPPPKPRKQAPPPAAPPTRGTNSAGRQTHRLTPDERMAARISGISDEDYLKEKLKLTADGAFTRH